MTVRVLREFVGWWPLASLKLDGVTVDSDVQLVALDDGVRPDLAGHTWRDVHIDDAGKPCFWLDEVDVEKVQRVFARPTPAASEVPVYEMTGTILRY